jgi:hypothetical protein
MDFILDNWYWFVIAFAAIIVAVVYIIRFTKTPSAE